jgi:hypothetical protein
MQLIRRPALLLIATTFFLGPLLAAPEARADDPAPNPAPRPGAPNAGGSAAAAPDADDAPSSGSNLTARVSAQVAAYQDSTATSVLTPSVGASVDSPTAGWGVNGRYLVDMVSAASPDIVATASPRWNETRHGGSLGAKYKPGTFGVAAFGSVSYTPDYLSLGGGGQLTEEVDDKLLTLVQGYSFGKDAIGRTGTPFSVFSRELTYHAFSLGASRVVNTGLVLGVFGDAVLESGDQSKPYRYVPVFASDAAAKVPRGASPDEVAALRINARPLEQLPLSRQRWAVTGRLAWRLKSATVRLEERGYTDSWGLLASTTDARYMVDVSQRLILWPHLRVHVQSGVDFWKRAYTATGPGDLPAFRTGDRELGPLRNLGLGGGARLALGKAGSTEDFVLTATVDGTWTSFVDALYVKDRLSLIGVVGAEVTF